MKKFIGAFMTVILGLGIYAGTAGAYEYFDEPPFDKYLVSEGDTLSYIGERYSVDLDDLYRFNPHIEEEGLIAGSTINLVEDTESTERTTLSDSERDLLERLVQAEAKGENYEGKVAVAEVVFNRVDSSEFPDSVYGVIMEEGQFEPVTTGTINNSPDSEAVEAVQEALEGTNLVNSALFFWNPTTATSRWLEDKTVVTQIDNHEFLV
ncbi:cell wall hydrolase [Texcoconibacillus texcoconensis]|uniref:N-acetylmuramoyl-L-alanine amidase n=1 Tax=Texcoconibacillus texcoconensis TaxID=1095777 RepID=A0A840QV10_9BACI|nr:cell wall hydrolase [Texcoconibacillus texcoconensis]MBB5175108.1 N-acetylmuramoyl-L-alanine amidase [Texcoconibacillus texcoconensis]